MNTHADELVMNARCPARCLRSALKGPGQRIPQEQLIFGQVDGHQFEGRTVACCESGTSEQGKGLGRGSAKQLGRHGEEELVDEVARDQGVVETGSAFDHERFDATLGFEGQ